MRQKLLLALGLAVLLGAAPHAQSLSSQVLQLLTRINTWTAKNTFYDLRLVEGVPSDTALRFYVDNAGNLYFNGALVAGAGGGVTPHNLLSSTHTDTLAASVARGSLVVGNATPKWAALAIGAAGRFLRSDGTDASWGVDGSTLTNLAAANLTGTLPAISGANLTSLNASNLASGTIPLARIAGLLNAQVASGAAIAYAKLNLTGGVVNADISSSAAIAYSKLALTASLVNADVANSTLTFAKWAANGCTNLQVPQFNGTSWGCATVGSGSGTVTSVALALPAIFSVSGSPVTGSGTLTGSLATQVKNLVWAGPSSGADATPTFRALVNADFPTTGIVAGTYAKLTVNTAGIATAGSASLDLAADVGSTVLPRANGGTGVAVSADDTLLVGSGTAWVAQTLVDCATGLGYATATNTFSCPGGGPAHNFLSATHADTVAASPVRGDMVVANSTPKWTKVAMSATPGTLWTNNAVDPSWSATIARGTVTATSPWSWTQTWNNAAVTFGAFLVNITDTASAAASTLLDLQVGGVSQFSVTKAGAVTALTSVTTPLYTAPAGPLGVTATTNIVATVGSGAYLSVEDGGGTTMRLKATGLLLSGVLALSTTAPTIASGGCTSPAVTWANGTAAFLLTIGTSCTGIKTVTLTMPAASHLWACGVENNTSDAQQQTNLAVARATSTTAVVLTSYDRTTGLQEDFTASDTYLVRCTGG